MNRGRSSRITARGLRKSGLLVAALIAATTLWPVSGAAQTYAPDAFPRLDRTALDVAPPSSRVRGRRGAIQVVQSTCPTRPTEGQAQRIVDIAVQEWAALGFQTVDATRVEERRMPAGILPDDLNPLRAANWQPGVLTRIGHWETDRALDTTIAGYWAATPGGVDVITRQNRQWREGRGEVMWAEPWSAAFISWVMCEAGLGDSRRFRRDAGHRTYIDQAIAARDGRAASAAYVAYDAGEQPMSPGDLLCNSREGTRYDTLSDRRRQMGRGASAHCDIVVRVGDQRVNVIGGNVWQGVTLTILPLTDRGGAHMRPVSARDLAGSRTVFAHLKLRGEGAVTVGMDASPTIQVMSADALNGCAVVGRTC